MIIDVLFAIALIIACFKGYRKGLILALFSFAGFIIGLTAAMKLSAVVADHLKSRVNISDKWLPFISFLIVFAVTVLLVRWGGKLVEKSIESVELGWVNKLAGVLLYAVLYSIILSIFLFFAEKINFLKPSTI